MTRNSEDKYIFRVLHLSVCTNMHRLTHELNQIIEIISILLYPIQVNKRK